jgi:hypothetical protein
MHSYSSYLLFSGYLLYLAINDYIPIRAACSWSDLPNLDKSGVSSIPYWDEAAGFLKDWSQEWNSTFFGTFIFSIIPCLK